MCVVHGKTMGPVMEFAVDDLVEARSYGLQNGCKVIATTEAGEPLYFRDKYGLVFHLTGS